ncbi:hypothetical protein [Actinophytocola sediminis]
MAVGAGSLNRSTPERNVNEHGVDAGTTEVHLIEQYLVIEHVLFSNVGANSLLDLRFSLLLLLMILAHIDEGVYIMSFAVIRIDQRLMCGAGQGQIFVAIELILWIGVNGVRPSRTSRPDVSLFANNSGWFRTAQEAGGMRPWK